MQNKNRYLVIIAVAGAHAVILRVLIGSPGAISLPSWTGVPLTAFILRLTAHPRTPIARPQLGATPAPLVPLVEPITLAPPPLPVRSLRSHDIDWDVAAREAAASVLERKKRISFGFPAGGQSALTLGVPSSRSPAHHAGESYRTESGEVIQWTSDRCYLVSDPPSLAEPDFLKNARITHFGCLPPPGPPPGELFKSLPAYKKYHPR
ncbi:MAG: hypothetical protein ACREV7_14125 [Steroidobacteraceae bacterium]